MNVSPAVTYSLPSGPNARQHPAWFAPIGRPVRISFPSANFPSVYTYRITRMSFATVSPYEMYTIPFFANSGCSASPISPFSPPRFHTFSTVCTGSATSFPSLINRTRPARSVSIIEPSGKNAIAHGTCSPLAKTSSVYFTSPLLDVSTSAAGAGAAPSCPLANPAQHATIATAIA